ncbi:MAG: hypothetical protein K9H61_09100 [Bacteroidia bacterium]|nr:hypothetical protein [Bacteroidia bacterium]MCF8447137.1 hypothetical protein [Bacteroidia bacterium]
MRKILLLTFSLFVVASLQAQIKKYSTSSGEIIFSFADYKINNEQVNTPVRFTCFFHLGGYEHFDFNDKVGIYTGLAIRNVGFTSKNNSGDTLIKRRNYYLGVPLAIKIGNLKEDKYLFFGVEGDLAFHYKEKLFVAEKKVDKTPIWFSDRTNTFMPSAFVGVNFKSGLNLKFKYYLKDFYNKEFISGGVKIYENVSSSQMFYFSLAMNLRNSNYSNKSYNKGI